MKRIVLHDGIGQIELLEHLGSDAAIVAAARISYTGQKMTSSDVQLLRYLMRQRHTSPFEMCELKFKVVAPIFVARQWMRHRTGCFNEQSARYSQLDDRFYVPEPAHIGAQSQSNRQGREAATTELGTDAIQDAMSAVCLTAYNTYTDLLKQGVAREIARMVLPVSVYTEFIWKVNLHNLLHFCHLRADSHAQYEIQVYAKAIIEMLDVLFPATTTAWKDYVRDAVSISRPAQDVIGGRDLDATRLSQRERAELLQQIKRLN